VTTNLSAHYTLPDAPILKPVTIYVFIDFSSHLNLTRRELTLFRSPCTLRTRRRKTRRSDQAHFTEDQNVFHKHDLQMP